ncbi:MAG: hypothetical protein PHV33_07335 [Elusimicrobiales bacterium]|nr:hypothetical protein [Elusimicrobiales bacterium]
MQGRSSRPFFLLMSGVFALAAGSFFTVLHVGMNELRGGRGIAYGFGSRQAAQEKPTYAEALAAGGKALAGKARQFFGGASAGPAPESLPGEEPQTAEERPEQESDPLEDFYDRNYGRGGEKFYAQAPGAWAGSGGSASAGAAAPDLQEGGQKAAGAWTGKAATGERAAGAPEKPAFGSPGARSPSRQAEGGAPKLARSLALAVPERPGEPGGGSLSSGPRYGAGGGLEGMRGQAGAADLNGADEGSRSSSANSYNSKLSGGAKAAAASGGTPPAASAAANAEGGGGTGATSGSGGTAAADAKRETPSEKSAPTEVSSNEPAAEELKPFLEWVAVEKRNGRDTRFISEEDAAAKVDAGQLKTGDASAEEPKPKKESSAGAWRDWKRDGPREPPPPDPKNFSELSNERKLEVKQRIHGFIKRVENHYGAMEDIFYTPCSAGRELCKEHGLTEGYLTLETREEAELHLGLKYIKERWRRYTIGFTLPRGHQDWKQFRPQGQEETPQAKP